MRNKIVVEAVLAFLFFLQSPAFAQCNCDETKEVPFVVFTIPPGLPLYGNPWKVHRVELAYHLQAPGEPQRCFADLELIDTQDPALSEPFIEVLYEWDFEVHFLGKWTPASEVAKVLQNTACLSLM